MLPAKAVTCGRVLSCFEVDPITGKTKLEAGAPPDEFVPKGQGWGNPTYAWRLTNKTDLDGGGRV